MRRKSVRLRGRVILCASSLALLLTGCTGLLNGKLFKERAAETPAPSEQTIDKSFFVDAGGQPKNFLCAWAPEIGQGAYGERYLTVMVNEAVHCNMQFEITENYLLGRIVQPSFPNDRSRWKIAVKIPIVKHFYYEHAKDSHGRDTNEWIENDQRSHWSARPKMKLDLAHADLQGLMSNLPIQISDVHDIEWDMANNFLGFSIDVSAADPSFEGEMQGTYRVNFLKFDHNPNFKKVPYDQEDARYMNILHVMGRKIEGITPELYAAHWDLSKTHNVYLNGVPKELQKDVAGAIYRWDKTLQEIGAVAPSQTPFVPVLKDIKHPFDLRYPSINWVSDKRISMYSPLGIGMAQADVKNGEILYGSIVLFGGILEKYINVYTPTDSVASETASSQMNSGMHAFQQILSLMPDHLQPMMGLSQITPADRDAYTQNLKLDMTGFLDGELAKLQAAGSKGGVTQARVNQLRQQIQEFRAQDPNVNKIAADFIRQAQLEVQKVSNDMRMKSVSQMLGAPNGNYLNDAITQAQQMGRPDIANLLKENRLPTPDQMARSFTNSASPFFVEKEMTAANMMGGWLNAPARKTRAFPDMLNSVVMNLTLHEFGHMIGLGHQFKENIIPKAGTVPSRYIKELQKHATEEAGYTNFSSVMGYQSGQTEMAMPIEDLKPGPDDELVLRYLYKSQYATYDRANDNWVFAAVPPSGKIPAFSRVKTQGGQAKLLPTSYFPACNDIEASLGADPYCNRWDRGSTAVEIVKSYFQMLSDNLLGDLYSLVGGGADAEGAEGRLWYSSIDTFSRVRLFYDEMRRRLRAEPQLKDLWNQLRTDQDALFEFSSACQKPNPTDPAQVASPVLRKIFADPDMVDLCRANAVALNEFRFYLELPQGDSTKVDSSNRYVGGGFLEGDATANYGHIFGSWYQMTNFPLKMTTLLSLFKADPFLMYGPFLVPDPYYNDPENRVLYRTLYPREYTQLVSTTIQHNMEFAATGTDDTTTMGRAILATGGLLSWQQTSSNDAARLPRQYNDLLDQQTQFQYGMVAVLIKAVPPDAASNVKADHYKKFTATIYDPMTNKESAASDVFILPKGQVFVWANGMFLYPITKLKFYGPTDAYVFAYKVSYDYEEGDSLVEDSVKSALQEKHKEIAEMCLNGFNDNGLLKYFDSSNPQFEGFKIPPGIDTEVGKEPTTTFYNSIDEEFGKYEQVADPQIPASFPIKRMTTVCDESIRGVGQILSSAGLLNGYVLGITLDYLEK